MAGDSSKKRTARATSCGVELRCRGVIWCDAPNSSPLIWPDSSVTPGATLTGTIGSPDKPDAFEVGLTDASGATVTTLPAGDYSIVVNDRSRIHNWVLSGDGVDAATDVSGTGEMTFEVTLKAGEYTYICDPHPSMKGSLTVT